MINIFIIFFRECFRVPKLGIFINLYYYMYVLCKCQRLGDYIISAMIYDNMDLCVIEIKYYICTT